MFFLKKNHVELNHESLHSRHAAGDAGAASRPLSLSVLVSLFPPHTRRYIRHAVLLVLLHDVSEFLCKTTKILSFETCNLH